MRIRNEGNPLNYFFLAPAKFLGNKQSAYGMKLSISLLMSSNASLIETRTDGDIILKGKDTNFVLVKQLPYLPYASRSKPVEYSVSMLQFLPIHFILLLVVRTILMVPVSLVSLMPFLGLLPLSFK